MNPKGFAKPSENSIFNSHCNHIHIERLQVGKLCKTKNSPSLLHTLFALFSQCEHALNFPTVSGVFVAYLNSNALNTKENMDTQCEQDLRDM